MPAEERSKSSTRRGKKSTGAEVATQRVKPSPSFSSSDMKEHYSRLRRFFARYSPNRTEQEMMDLLQRYNGRYPKMWDTLTRRYGPEKSALKKSPPDTAFVPSEPWVESKQRLLRFYSFYVPEKSESEVEDVLRRYNASLLGLPGMWEQLVAKYGPEVSEKEEHQTLAELRAFLAHYDPSRSADHATQLFRAMALRTGGVAQMWRELEARYGPRDFSSAAPPAGRRPQFCATALPAPTHLIQDDAFRPPAPAPAGGEAFSPPAPAPAGGGAVYPTERLVRVPLALRVGGDWARYRRAAAAVRTEFCDALARDVAENADLAPQNVDVHTVASGQSGGMECVLVIDCGSTPHAMETALRKRVTQGTFTLHAARSVYVCELGGRATDLCAERIVRMQSLKSSDSIETNTSHTAATPKPTIAPAPTTTTPAATTKNITLTARRERRNSFSLLKP